MFRHVLTELAPTTVVELDPDPSYSQRATVVVRTVGRLRRALRRSDHPVVMTELAGRGLAEFWTVWLLCASRRTPFPRRGRPQLWVTVHDSPAVTGGAFFFWTLDRRGLRRLAQWLSDTVGRRAERWVLRHVDQVFCLSEQGVAALTMAYGLQRSVRQIEHVALAPELDDAPRRSVFFPGYVRGAHNVVPVLQALAQTSADWTIELGACDDETVALVRDAAAALEVGSRLRVSGFVTEADLAASFRRAAVVVRFRHGGWAESGEAQYGAVSGPLIQAMAYGCAIVTNDRRGIAGCLAPAKAMEIPDGEDGERALTEAILLLVDDSDLARSMGHAGRAHIVGCHTAQAVAGDLRRKAIGVSVP